MIPGHAGRHPVATFLWWQGAGFALLFCHMGIAALSGSIVPAYAFTAPTVVLLYLTDSMAGFAVFLQFLMYQNLAISMVSGLIDAEVYRGLQGTNFALMLMLSALSALRLWESGRNRRTLLLIGAAATVVVAYTAYGALQSSLGSAIVYFRSSIAGIVGLVFGWELGRRHGYREVGLCYLTSMAVGVAFAVCEVAAPLTYYDWIGAADYYRLKWVSDYSLAPIDFQSAQDVVQYLTKSFFNIGDTDPGLETARFGGPNMHSVSYGYLLSFGTIVALSLGVYWSAAILLPLLYLIGVKGSATMLAGTVVLWIAGRLFGKAFLCVFGAILVLVYISVVIGYGLSVGDYHVIGLLGGINGFLHNPIGHGIGVGGNLSATVEATDLDAGWKEFQLYGADQALESAIGVLVYQMGIGAVAVLYAAWIPFRATIKEVRRSVGLVPLALAAVMLNGLFQEEAFSPYALALVSLFAGVLYANSAEVVPAVARKPRFAFAR